LSHSYNRVSSCSNTKRLSLKASSYIVQLLKRFSSLHSVSNLCQFIQFGEFECYVLCQIYGADSGVWEHWCDAVYSGR